MTENEQIQITYEDDSRALPAKIEQLIQTNLLKLLKNTGNEGKIISLYFCQAPTIQKLNLSHRNIDKATDILSWSYESNETFTDSEPWGELAICLDVCIKQAEASDWSLETELLRLLVHGLGHLMGYDHERSEEDEAKMLAMEKIWLSSINLEGLYD